MKLYEALNKYKGYQIKVGSKASFYYCEINDNNTENVINQYSKEEYIRIVEHRDKLQYQFDNFDSIFENSVPNRIKCFTYRTIKNKEFQDKINEFKRFLPKDKKYRAGNEKRIEKYEEKLFKKIQTTEEFQEKLTAFKDELPVVKNRELNKLKRELHSFQKRVADWIPFLERDVLEIYDSIVEPNCKIIRTKGLETSPFWNKEEYRNFLNRGKVDEE